MEKILAFIGATVLGTVGWWIGDHVGFMTAFVLSIVGTGFGVYVGRRAAKDYLG
jgi:hypothetical protein